MESERSLLNAIAKGNREAMQRLYQRYAGSLMAVCMRYLGNRDDARDVLQDCFVKILTHVNAFQYRGEGSLQAWMKRIAVNEALDFLHKEALFTHSDQLADMPDTPEPDVGGVPPDVLQQMITSLPAGYRVVLNLYVFEEKSHKEIARLLGIKEDSSASQFFRAKKLLSKKIYDYLKQTEK